MTLKTDYAVEEIIPAVENLIKNRDWRDDAIHASLATEAEDGDSIDTLLRETRRAQRGCATLMLWLDRPRLREFLQTQATGFRSLLPGTDGYRGYETADDVRPYVAWYAAEWEGRTIEVALAPTTAYTGYVLCIADEETYLHRFAEAAVSFVNRPVGRSLRYAQGWESAEDIDAQIGLVTWEDIVLPPAQTAQIRDAVEGFVQSRETYARFGFAWRRGILLIGPPGTGKTMICKAVASSLPSLPFLYVRDLSERAKRDAIQAIFERARQLAPCILVFEDMDGFITKENRTLFLNEMDGFKNNDGLLVIASSNHPDKIDEALIKRPSRFDRVFHIGLPGPEERREYCRQVLTRSAMSKQIAPSLDIEHLAQQVAERTEKFTPAYLKEALLSAALLRAHAGAEQLDSTYAEAVLGQIEEMRASFKRLKNLAALGEISTGMDTMGLRR